MQSKHNKMKEFCSQGGNATEPAEHHVTAASSASESAPQQTYKWQVQFPSGWQDLPSDASADIEREFSSGSAEAQYQQCRSKKENIWNTYQITFKRMQQQNLQSGRLREARRIPIHPRGSQGYAHVPDGKRSRTNVQESSRGTTAGPSRMTTREVFFGPADDRVEASEQMTEMREGVWALPPPADSGGDGDEYFKATTPHRSETYDDADWGP